MSAPILLRAQDALAAKLNAEMLRYAAEIGCGVAMDEIQVYTKLQQALLGMRWEALCEQYGVTPKEGFKE